MFRICLCLLHRSRQFDGSAAREIKLSSANSGSCPESIALERDASPCAQPRAAAPAREAKAKPSVAQRCRRSSRMQSPRWHSFLPGMFR